MELVVTDNVPVCTVDPIDFAATDRVQLEPDAIVVPQLFVENAILLVIGPMAIGEAPLLVTITSCETPAFVKSSDKCEKTSGLPESGCPVPVNGTCTGEFGALLPILREAFLAPTADGVNVI